MTSSITNDVCLDEALVLHQAHKLSAAVEIYQQVLVKDSQNVKALHFLGLALHQQGNDVQAILLMQKSLAFKPDYAACYNNLGELYRKQGEAHKALDAYKQAIKFDANQADAYSNLGLLCASERNFSKAETYYKKSLAIKPKNAVVCNNLGELLFRRNQIKTAEQYYLDALKIQPSFLSAYHNLGLLYEDQANLKTAENFYQQALLLEPQNNHTLNLLGSLYWHQQQFERAEILFQQGLTANIKPAIAYFKLGHIFYRNAQYQRASKYLTQALAIDPDYVSVKWVLAHIQLTLGNYKQGFEYYEYRFKFDSRLQKLAYKTFNPATLWQGEALTGQTLLVYYEQGFGDTIQFFRYLALLVDKSEQIIFCCRKELKTLFSKAVHPKITVINKSEPLPAYDKHVFLMSLPRLLNTTPQTIPAKFPYLFAFPQAKTELLCATDRLNIGFVWNGSQTNTNNKRRSVTLENFLPLFSVPNTQFYSLQLGAETKLLQTLPLKYNIIDCSREIQDFADTAALVAQLDLVIMIDSGVAHLTAALGKPVWICVTQVPDWRWLLERNDSPWYPSLRLFRQLTQNNWDTVFMQIRAALLITVAKKFNSCQ